MSVYASTPPRLVAHRRACGSGVGTSGHTTLGQTEGPSVPPSTSVQSVQNAGTCGHHPRSPRHACTRGLRVIGRGIAGHHSCGDNCRHLPLTLYGCNSRTPPPKRRGSAAYPDFAIMFLGRVARGCSYTLSEVSRRAQQDCIVRMPSASVEAPREPLGGLCGCSPRRPPFCRRSRSARGQGRLRWRFYLCARCICGASPHLSVPRLLPKNAHAHLLRVAWQVAGASKRLQRPTTTSNCQRLGINVNTLTPLLWDHFVLNTWRKVVLIHCINT